MVSITTRVLGVISFRRLASSSPTYQGAVVTVSAGNDGAWQEDTKVTVTLQLAPEYYASYENQNGSLTKTVDWDALGGQLRRD